MKRNHAGATVRMTGPKTGLIFENGNIYLYKFARRGGDRRPEWHLHARRNEAGKLMFRSRRAIRNYETFFPEIDPADLDLMRLSFTEHVTHTRDYRREAREKELRCRGGAFSRGAAWVRDRKDVSQAHCMFFPGAVCYAPVSVTYNYQPIAAARAMCLEAHGRPADQSHVVRHKCAMGHMSCVNPAHLAWGTVADNGRDMSLHRTQIFDPSEYPSALVASIAADRRLTKVIAWDLQVPAALVSAIKLAE